MDSIHKILRDLPQLPPDREPSLVITACDTYEGETLASKLADYLAECRSSDSESDPTAKQLVCLARNPEKCGHLKKKSNVKIVRISYDQPNSISIALRGIQTVVLIPEIKSQRVDWANQMIDIMAQEKVIRCILISSIGADAGEKEQLNRFMQTEDKVKRTIQRWTILREGFPLQTLLYWIPMIQDQEVLGMSIKPDAEFSPLDINNLGDALISVTIPAKLIGHDQDRHASDQSNRDHSESIHDDTDDGPALILDNLGRFDGQIYTLTGPETLTGPKVADKLNRALSSNLDDDDGEIEGSVHQDENEDFPTPIMFKQVPRDELRAHLVSLRNKGQGALDESRRLQLQNMPGISGAIRLFQLATDAAFGGRRPHHGLTAIHYPETSTSEDEEGIDKGEGIRDGMGTDDGLNKDHECTNDPCKCPKKGPHKPDEPGEIPPKHHTPQLEAPNDDEVDLILDLLDYINEGRAAFQSGDLKKVVGIRGGDAMDFFGRYSQDLRPRPRKDL